MRILFLQNTASLGAPTLSGGEIRLYQIVKRLRSKQDCSVRPFFSLNHMNTDFSISSTLVRRYKLYDRFSIYGAYLLKCLDLLVHFIFSREKYDLVYAASDFFPDVFPAFFYRVSRKRSRWVQCIFHLYPDWRKRPGNKMVNFVAQHLQAVSHFFVGRFADRVIVINQGTAEALLQKGFPQEKIVVSPCGVDVEALDALPVRGGSYEGIFLARLHSTKGIFDLLKIWKQVGDWHPSARLGVIGGGKESLVGELRAAIDQAGLKGKIDVLGYLKDEEAFSLLKSARVFLFPSHEEGWGIALTEAMACRVPVVAWDLPVYREIFGGILETVPENDFEAFARKVSHWLSSEEDRQAVVERAFGFVRRYSWDKVAEAEETILNQVQASS